MVKRNPKTVLTGILSLALAVSAIAPGTASAEEPTLKELATASREKAAKAREATIRLILARQKGDQLKVYLRGSRSMFINGKSISTGILSTVIKESGLEQAVITTSPDVHPDRVAEIEKLIQKDGIENVKAPEPKTLQQVVAESRAKVARDREATLREVLSRQKGDQLKVYLNTRGAYVNGRAVSSSLLSEIVSASGLEDAVLTAEGTLTEEKVAAVQKVLETAGIKNVKRGTAKPAESKEAKLRVILSRQKGDVLKVYLNSRGAYVNGKSISKADVAKLVSESGLEQVAVTAESYLTDDAVAAWTTLIEKAGVEEIAVSRKQ